MSEHPALRAVRWPASLPPGTAPLPEVAEACARRVDELAAVVEALAAQQGNTPARRGGAPGLRWGRSAVDADPPSGPTAPDPRGARQVLVEVADQLGGLHAVLDELGYRASRSPRPLDREEVTR